MDINTPRFLFFARPVMSSSVNIWFCRSRLLVGSSRIIISGSCAKALAIKTLWRSPPLISLIFLKANFCKCSFSIRSKTMSLSSVLILRPAKDILPSIIVSITFIENTLLLYCGTYPIFFATIAGVMFAIFSPFIVIFPLLGVSIWFIHFKSVVFPVPLGPKRNMLSPLLSSKLISESISLSLL